MYTVGIQKERYKIYTYKRIMGPGFAFKTNINPGLVPQFSGFKFAL